MRARSDKPEAVAEGAPRFVVADGDREAIAEVVAALLLAALERTTLEVERPAS